ncbi:hypothetical protein CEXT_625731 [Caerostris extrusa]|uniref:Uncharacterized protein n=1 Tax=Caerostris extrusa TaxID=172846 RepID=A0AAV4MA90_CAEEX|nr:hypothetical protein CEXT_625731 [Caerostris extrusa]
MKKKSFKTFVLLSTFLKTDIEKICFGKGIKKITKKFKCHYFIELDNVSYDCMNLEMRNADCKKRLQVSRFVKSILMPEKMPAQQCICSMKTSFSTTRRHLCSREKMSITECENQYLIHSSLSDHPFTHSHLQQ